MSGHPEQTPASANRPEFETELGEASVIGDVERPLTVIERIANNEAVQRLTILVVLIVIWELYARWLNNALLFPTFTETLKTFSKDIANGVLVDQHAIGDIFSERSYRFAEGWKQQRCLASARKFPKRR